MSNDVRDGDLTSTHYWQGKRVGNDGVLRDEMGRPIEDWLGRKFVDDNGTIRRQD